MKIKLLILIIVLLPSSKICKAEVHRDTIFIPKEITSSSIKIISWKNNLFTAVNSGNTKFWQFKSGSAKCELMFAFEESFHKEIFKGCFPDKNEYDNTSYALEVNNAKEPLSRITGVYVSPTNNIYAFVTSQLARPMPGRDPKKDFTLYPFFAIIKIGNGKIDKIFYIPEPVINNEEYVVFEGGNFFMNDTNEFVLTVTKVRESDPMPFLSKWRADPKQNLHFTGLYSMELSPMHKEKKINYGLLNFIQKQGMLVFNISPYLYNLKTESMKKLAIENLPDLDVSGLKYGGNFEIKFSICDFSIYQDTLILLCRLNDSILLKKYSAITYSFISEITLGLKAQQLGHAPFLDEENNILIYDTKNRTISQYR